jgi:hypothetical protein
VRRGVATSKGVFTIYHLDSQLIERNEMMCKVHLIIFFGIIMRSKLSSSLYDGDAISDWR